jgi:hypothetical protein
MIFAPAQPRIVVPTRCPHCGKWRMPRVRRRTPRTNALRRIFPRWRGGVPALNVGSGLQVSSTGLVVSLNGLVVSDGTEANADTCCCTGGGDGAACGNCDVTPPLQYTLVFDSLTRCSQCDGTGGIPAHSFKFTAGDPNGTFTVTQDTGSGGAGPCVWVGDGPSTFGVKEWSGNFCSGSVESDETNLPAKITLIRMASGKFDLDYWLPYSNAFWSNPRFFRRAVGTGGEITGSCFPLTPISASNGLGACTFAQGATGGTVTISPV